MSKRIVIKIGSGSVEKGYAVAVQIGEEGKVPNAETQGQLPPAPDIPALYQQWQQSYWQLGLSTRIKAASGVTNVSTTSDVEQCRRLSQQLRDRVHHWLNGSEFLPIREKILEQLSPTDQVRILLQTQDPLLQRIPWYDLHFFERYRQAEVGICLPNYQQVNYPGTRSAPVRILAVLGDATGLDTQIDQDLLSQLPNADIHFLRSPNREQFNRSLWDNKGWDILFFAGHSSSYKSKGTNKFSDAEGSGEILLNATDRLTIPQLKHALKKAIDRGLNTAIFNSCDGLGLAADLADLHIPQVLVMREPVPDLVAHAFLQGFLESFAAGAPFYIAVREAREKMQGLEAQFPCATWLPVVVQNLAEMPATWQSLQGKDCQVASVLPSQSSVIAAPLRQRIKAGIGAAIVISTAMVFARQMGLVERWDIAAYDQFIRAKPTENVDSQILIITNTDIDVAERPDSENRSSLSDETLLELLNQLMPLNPNIVGLDIYRDFAANNSVLKDKLTNTSNLVMLCKGDDATSETPAIAPPPEVLGKPDRFGSSDFVYSGKTRKLIRRHLLVLDSQPPCDARNMTFSTVIARRYLEEVRGINLGEDSNPDDGLQMGSVLLPVIQQSSFGGYHNLDTQGLQILLNYRRLNNPAQTNCGAIETPARCLTVGEVLAKSPEELYSSVQNRIILIGTTALRFDTDRWGTPFTPTSSIEDQTPGVFLQAQMISQLINAELAGRPLYTAWPEGKEIAWIASWALLGGLLSAVSSSGPKLGLRLLMGEGLLLLTCWFWLMRGGVWLPLVPSATVLPAAATGAQMVLMMNQRKQLSNHER